MGSWKHNCYGGFIIIVTLLFSVFLTPSTCQEETNHSTVENGETSQSNPTSVIPDPTISTETLTPKKLKTCEGTDISVSPDLSRDRLQLPVLVPTERKYEMVEYGIDQNDTLKTCVHGTQPISNITIITKHAYDADSHTDKSLIKLLRSTGHVLLENGYLSVVDSNIIKYYSPTEYCLSGVKGEGDSTTATFRLCDFSVERPIFHKCCPWNMALAVGQRRCQGYQHAEKWDAIYIKSTNTSEFIPLDEFGPTYVSAKLKCTGERKASVEGSGTDNYYYSPEDNMLEIKEGSRLTNKLNVSLGWCMDRNAVTPGEQQRMILYYCTENQTEHGTPSSAYEWVTVVYMSSMYIGAGFHLLTTLVYIVTWRKQNIHGKTLCSCTFSLFFMQLFLGTTHLLSIIKVPPGSSFCVANGILGHYFMIAAFMWMLVVNFDLWRTFRRIRTDGGTEMRRFLVYSAFGWGLPFLVSLVSVSLDFMLSVRASGFPIPDYGVELCFVAHASQDVYVYLFLTILFVCSFIFAGLTLFALYKFKKEAGKLRSNQRLMEQNILLFLRLFVVMGFTWAFEVISWATSTGNGEGHIIWIILDLYNILSAILIFVIFVCKRGQLLVLEQIVPPLKGLTAALTKVFPCCCRVSTRTWDPENTPSTGTTDRKWSITSQVSTLVRYTTGKRRRESNESREGNQGKVSEQTGEFQTVDLGSG